LDPIQTFRDEVRAHFRGVSRPNFRTRSGRLRSHLIESLRQKLKGPFNDVDRLKAGMAPEYYEDLEGKPWKYTPPGTAELDVPEGGKEPDGDLRIHPRLT
jgi:hypothetical protein